MLHTIKNEFLAVTAAEKGAELQSILCADGTECLWQGDSAYWSGRAPNIFPYVARLTEGSYRMDGALYHMSIHGIAPYARFALKEHREDQMTLELSSDEETLAVYPRQFAFRVIYRLDGPVLHITYEVENRDGRTMYFGLGGHPGFNVPLGGNGRFEDCCLRFGSPCEPVRIGFTEDCFLSGRDTAYPLEDGRTINLRHDLFDQDAIVLKNTDRQVTLESPGSGRSITVAFPQMQYVGFWHMPKTDAPYVCIEPWCSLPAAHGKLTVFEQQDDLISLAPGGTYRNDWSIAVNSAG